ncbi:MAG: Com family DNA-binding transcriptional regulator [Pseudomonadota bacterium]
MRELRCTCGRKLAEWDGAGHVEIKCPKCGKLMQFGPGTPYPDRRPHHGHMPRQRDRKA